MREKHKCKLGMFINNYVKLDTHTHKLCKKGKKNKIK